MAALCAAKEKPPQSPPAHNDTVHKSLKPPYEGPFKVIERNSKIFLIQLPNRQVRVSIDRLKPAYVLIDQKNDIFSNNNGNFDNSQPNEIQDNGIMHTNSQVVNPFVTRYGRITRPPVRFTNK
ncbi:hypothetical protein ACJJTC_010143 [Scirpophaga incertulas]